MTGKGRIQIRKAGVKGVRSLTYELGWHGKWRQGKQHNTMILVCAVGGTFLLGTTAKTTGGQALKVDLRPFLARCRIYYCGHVLRKPTRKRNGSCHEEDRKSIHVHCQWQENYQLQFTSTKQMTVYYNPKRTFSATASMSSHPRSLSPTPLPSVFHHSLKRCSHLVHDCIARKRPQNHFQNSSSSSLFCHAQRELAINCSEQNHSLCCFSCFHFPR